MSTASYIHNIYYDSMKTEVRCRRYQFVTSASVPSTS
jgi:hypothetical protein